MTATAVHFAPGLDARHPACGAVADCGLLVASHPAAVTCRRACKGAAARADLELRLLARRAIGARLVFLDFDGVLNHLAFFEARKAASEQGLPSRGSLDRVCVARLNRLLVEADAKVVISSSWRTGSTVLRMRTLLEGFGFAGEVLGLTPDSGFGPRGREIRAWLDGLPGEPRAFVVLDDEGGMDGVDDHFVQTSFEAGGLTDAKVEEALVMLGCRS